MNQKYLLNRLFLSCCLVASYFLIFISMKYLNIVNSSIPLNGMPSYLCFWSLFLIYFTYCNSTNNSYFLFIRHGNIYKYLLNRYFRSLQDNCIYVFLFSFSIYAYDYIFTGRLILEHIVVFFITLLLSVSIFSLFLIVIRTFYGEKIMVIDAIFFVVLCEIIEISFFFSIRLSLSDNYYIKPLMMITKSNKSISNLCEVISVFGVWLIIITMLLGIIKKFKRIVYNV